MSPNVVRTVREERLWDKAKDIADEAGHKEDYPYIMGVFKKMNPKRFSNDLSDRISKMASDISDDFPIDRLNNEKFIRRLYNIYSDFLSFKDDYVSEIPPSEQALIKGALQKVKTLLQNYK